MLFWTLDMVPSSSGPGHQVLILKIAGSNPAGITIRDSFVMDGSFIMSNKG